VNKLWITYHNPVEVQPQYCELPGLIAGNTGEDSILALDEQCGSFSDLGPLWIAEK
jgi:hypothetical protein